MLPIDTATRAMQVIDLVRAGKTLLASCREVGITRQSIIRLTADPQWAALFDEAVHEGYDTLAELMINIDTEVSDPKMAAVISKNIQWFLARRQPKTYGDRVAVDVTITADKTIIAALQAAKERLPDYHDGPTLELTAEPPLVVTADDLW